MKNIIAALFAVVVAVPAAAVPDVVTYAARVENDAGPFDGTVSAVFQLFDAPIGGTVLWSETAASVVVVDGDLVHELGSVEALDDSVLARDDVFLAVTFNGDTLSPRAAIRAVPFALKARDAETLGGLSADDVATDAEVAALNFANLPGVPAGFADLVDNDTVATAAAAGGLKVTANAFAIDDNAITLSRMGDNSVSSAEVVADSLTAADLGPASVSTSELAPNAVTAAAIRANEIKTDKLAGNEVQVRPLPSVTDANGDIQQVCGNGLTSSTSCETVTCKSSTDALGFYDCTGRCLSILQNPVTCTVSTTVVGLLLSTSAVP